MIHGEMKRKPHWASRRSILLRKMLTCPRLSLCLGS